MTRPMYRQYAEGDVQRFVVELRQFFNLIPNNDSVGGCVGKRRGRYYHLFFWQGKGVYVQANGPMARLDTRLLRQIADMEWNVLDSSLSRVYSFRWGGGQRETRVEIRLIGRDRSARESG